MKALTLELPFTHIHTHTHTAWSAAQTPQTHCRRNPIDRDHHVSIADGHRVKGIMWESITAAASELYRFRWDKSAQI